MRIIGTNHTNVYPVQGEKEVFSVSTSSQKMLTQEINTGEALKEAALESSVSNQAPKKAELENISLTFNKDEIYEYIGKEKEIENLDVQKAVQGAKKDEILQQYHYFVGSPGIGEEIFSSEDGTVISK